MASFLMILLFLLAVICFEAMGLAILWSDNKRLKSRLKEENQKISTPVV